MARLYLITTKEVRFCTLKAALERAKDVDLDNAGFYLFILKPNNVDEVRERILSYLCELEEKKKHVVLQD